MGHIALYGYLIVAVWLILRDARRRQGISGALWIPAFWLGISLSRPLSAWLGFGGASDTLEGSPLDRMVHFLAIGHAVVVLNRRRLNWGKLAADNWPLLLFYCYFLISTLWAYDSFVAFKRWFKDLGMVLVVLVILTEQNPKEAIRAVFVRCAYLLLPLSVIFIKWFPEWGRFYSSHGGQGELTGVTTQKNSLGITAMICGLMFLWDWLEYRRNHGSFVRKAKFEKYFLLVAMGLAIYLIQVSQSKTSLICFLIGASLVAMAYGKLGPILMRRISTIVIISAGLLYLMESTIHFSQTILEALGRDASFTGRTDIWRVMLEFETNPLIGTGFYSFWSDPFYRAKIPDWMGFSVHNGYLEVYIDGGWIGIFVLAVLIISTWSRIGKYLKTGDPFAMVRFASLLVVLIGCFAESHFARIGPMWFLFILTTFDPRMVARALPSPGVVAPLRHRRVISAALPTPN